MKTTKKWISPLLAICLFVSLWSCSEMDEYKEFTEGGEISYTEKVDSLEVYSGRNKVLIEGLVTADPKVSEYRVYWNSGKDSIVVPVERSPGVDTLTTMITDLPENIYNFEVRTFDEAGNSSIPVYATAEVFGERYQNSLSQRPVVSNTMIGSELTINYAGMDLTSGVIGTEVDYSSTAGGEETVFVPIDSSHVFIDDFNAGSTYEYRTVFLPEPTSIDTFYTGYKAYTPEFQITERPYFKNACYPFEIEADGGRWATPADWIHNEAALSHDGYGALDGEIFDLESGWGQPAINNGKVYQTMVLEPGTYAYVIDIREMNYEAIDNKDKAYFVVAEGSTLPDVDKIETSDATLAYERINKANGLQRSLVFTIPEVTQVSIGVGATLTSDAGRYMKIKSFALGEVSESPTLLNASVPFEASEINGRWGNLAHWTANDSIKNHSGYGGWDEWNGNIFNIESGWGAPAIENGKIYQSLVVAPGTYTFKVNFRMVNGTINTNHQESDEGSAYFVVAAGCTLPDVSDVETASATLEYEQIDADKTPEDFEMTFTVEDYRQISVGQITTQPNSTPGRFANITSFELFRNE